jgi:parallel beta-helix repeat protein
VLLVTLGLVPLVRGAEAPTFHVSPDGRDTWSGTLAAPNPERTDGPFASLAGALQGIRKTRPQGEMTQWTTVFVQAGTYCLSETLRIEPRDGRLAFAASGKEKPEIVGGRLVTGLKPGPDGVWSVALPEVKAGSWSFRSLFVDGRRMPRARYPNLDPTDPYRKGFAYVGRDVNAFGIAVGCIHNVGDWMDYRIEVPAAGRYAFWVYYGALNQPHGNTTMDGRTAVSVDGGEKTLLTDLPDTGSWAIGRWGRSAVLTLTPGEHTLRWENLKGGGLNLEAFALSDDEGWQPQEDTLPGPAPGRHVILIQAENFSASHGPQLQVGGTGKGARDRFPFAPGDLKPEWAQAPEAEIHIFQTGNCRAFKEICWIAGISAEDRHVTLKGPECTSSLHTGDRYFVENIRQLLDAPGEWYLDRQGGVLYLLPPPEFSEASEVMAPTIERIVEAPEGAYGVAFRGLAFRGGDWDFDDGCVGYGMGTNGVLYLKNARKCEVRDCTFSNLGKDAVCFEGGEANVLAGNDISDTAEGGINLNGTRATEVSGNHIHHLGRVYKHNGGITLQNGASNNHVAGNVIHDVPRYGITMKSAGHDNLIEHNRVLNTNLETYDTGAIEVTQQDRDERSGTTIAGNVVGDTIGYSSTGDKATFLSWGIYLDSFAGGYTVTGNLVYRNYHGGIMFQGGKDNRVRNNIFVDGYTGQGHISNFANNQTGCVLERNLFVFSNPQAYLFAAPALTREVITVDRNLYFCPGIADYVTGWNRRPFAEWQAAGFDAASVRADPLFADPARDDYRLRPDSPALALGFEPLALGQVPSCGCRIETLGRVYFEDLPWPQGYR